MRRFKYLKAGAIIIRTHSIGTAPEPGPDDGIRNFGVKEEVSGSQELQREEANKQKKKKTDNKGLKKILGRESMLIASKCY